MFTLKFKLKNGKKFRRSFDYFSEDLRSDLYDTWDRFADVERGYPHVWLADSLGLRLNTEIHQSLKNTLGSRLKGIPHSREGGRV
jgi:hypothetical protein